jgi:predicted transcriptional regulator
MTTLPPLTEQIRQEIRDSGMSIYRIAQLAGVTAPQIHRFLSGQRGLSLEVLDKICSVINMKVTSKP